MSAEYVYIIKVEDRPDYKIGQTNSMPRRMSQFVPLMPFVIAQYQVGL